MKRLVWLAALALLVGSASAAFAQSITTNDITPVQLSGTSCTSNCTNTGAQVQQNIQVTVPAAVRMVIDKAGDFTNWTLTNLAQPPYTATSKCFVVPNWVSADQLSTWITSATGGNVSRNADGSVNFGNLVPVTAAYGTTGYAPAFMSSGGSYVLTWHQVASGNPAYDTATTGGYPAKGNLLCAHSLMIEKYTNCDNAQFVVSVDYGTGSTTNGVVGDLYMGDYLMTSGLPSAGGTGGDLQAITIGATSPTTLQSSIPTGTWLDDHIIQFLYFGPATKGQYNMTATYTLGSATFISTLSN